MLKNSGFVLASQVWFTVLSLVTMPYIVRMMGVEAYGVLTILIAFTGYLSYLDLGLGWVLIKFVAEYEAKGDVDSLERSVATSLFVLCAGGLVGAGLLVALSGVVVHNVLHLPASLVEAAVAALWITGFTFAVSLPALGLTSVLKGLQRFELTSLLQILLGTLTTGGMLAVLWQGHGLRGVAAVNAVISVLGLVVHIAVISRVKPGLSLLPWLHLDAVRRMLSFSVFTTFSRLGIVALFQLDKLFIALFLPVAQVAYYAVPFNIAQKLTVVASNVGSVIFPLASERFSIDDREGYQRIYHHAVKLVFFLTAVPTVVLIAFARPLLQLWLGPDFALHGSTPLILLAVAFFVNSISSIEAISTEGAGRPRTTAGFFAVAGVMNILLGPLLTWRYGISGTALSLAVSLTVLAIMTIAFFNARVLRVKLVEALGKNYMRAVLVLTFVGPTAYVTAQLPVDSLIGLLAEMTALTLVLGGLGAWALLSRDERQALMALGFARLK